MNVYSSINLNKLVLLLNKMFDQMEEDFQDEHFPSARDAYLPQRQSQVELEEEAMRRDGLLLDPFEEEPKEVEETLMLRPYQSELEDIALKRNTIIYLPTGSGKTVIAIRVIKRFKKDLQAPWGQGGKRTFFLVNTVALVEQQKKSIHSKCPVHVNGYSSEDNVDYWKKSEWDEELAKYQVIVMTTQILADMLQHRYIKISDINLIIFDECHHATDDHPMRVVMKYFNMHPADEHPRILGLTATLLNRNISIGQVAKNIRDLEVTLHSTIATVNEMGEVLDFSTCPKEHILTYADTPVNQAAVEAMKVLNEMKEMIGHIKLPANDPKLDLAKNQKLMVQENKLLKGAKNLITEVTLFIEEFGVFGGSLSILAQMILLERLKRSATRHETLVYNSVITACTRARRILEDSMKNETGFKKLEMHSSKRILKLLDIFKQFNPEYKGPVILNKAKKKLCGILFTQRRFCAKLLYNLLKYACEHNPQEFGFLKHEFIVGCSLNPMKMTREASYVKKINSKVLTLFNNGDLNCLIATNLIEEGIDIPQCTMVLRFDPITDYRSYIQSKGRARNTESDFVVMVADSNQNDFRRLYCQFQQTERYLEQILVGSTNNRVSPTVAEIDDEDDEIQPYKNPYSDNMLTSISAISLLNRYCNKLPHDQFTTISPQCVLEEVDLHKKVVSIILPITARIRDPVKGFPMSSTKNAKRSAALNACIKLHQAGELDRVTMLPIAYCKVDYERPDVQSCFQNWRVDESETDKDFRAPGTQKRIRKHVKQYPKCLAGPDNWNSTQKVYLHIIHLKPEFEPPEDTRELALYHILKDKTEGLAFLSFNSFPELCEFPMCLTVGEVNTSIEVNYRTYDIDLSSFKQIIQFHYFIFDQVLSIAKRFMVHNGKHNALYVVPVIMKGNYYDIHWDIVKTFRAIVPIEEPSMEIRRDMKLNIGSYDKAVVTPWYRNADMPEIYLVTKVLEYKTPLSLLEGSSDTTFADYYRTRYGIEIYSKTYQPMLEVRNITTRMNCLLPRTEKYRNLSEKQKKLVALAQGEDRARMFKEYFVPELCILQKFPGPFWFKSTILPSIVHRISMLLLADELRSTIARDTGIGVATLPSDSKWQPIELNIDCATSSALLQVDLPHEVATIDRINNPIDETVPRTFNTMSMKDSLHKLKMKSIDKKYDWDPSMEPVDIDRNITSVTLMDIECYDEFVSHKEVADSSRSPEKKSKPIVTTAILGAPIDDKGYIKILKHQPNKLGPELRDVVAALTTIKSSDTFNLERPETLGDSFLKFAATLYLYHKFPKLNEGQLTNIKGRLIGNRNLFYAGERINLGGMMKTETFSPRKDFDLPAFSVPAEVRSSLENAQIRPTFLIGIEFSKEEIIDGQIFPYNAQRVESRVKNSCEAEPEAPYDIQTSMQWYVGAQAVRDKNIADCVEALIGTYLVSSGIMGATKILEWLRVIPKEDNFSSFYNKKTETALDRGTSILDINYYLNNCQAEVEQIIGYKFNDPSFLLEALSHPSYINNRVTRSYERLEFLGDAILDFLITAYIYENNVDLKPGQLTELRSSLVNNTTFAAFSVKLGLHKYMCSQFNPLLDAAIMKFVEHQESRNHQVEEEIIYLIDEADCKIVAYVEVPKCLSDMFESLAAAIYLDSGGDLTEVWRVFYNIMKKEIYMFSKNIPRQPVQVIHEMIHACPVFGEARVIDEYTSQIMIPITITKNGKLHVAYGCGANKFQAKRAAAKLALKLLAC